MPRSIARAAADGAARAGRPRRRRWPSCARSRRSNRVLKSFIGQGYHGTHTPGVILRNMLENPAWYTAYTPYQAEISQGRLEALVNFQTMVCDLTGMAIANASMLDEATAAAEAMTLAKRSVQSQSRRHRRRRRLPPADHRGASARAPRRSASRCAGRLGRRLAAGRGDDYFAVLAQYPATTGAVHDLRADRRRACTPSRRPSSSRADLLALTLLMPPGELGADIVVGTTQRFGVPMGDGGPHAAYLACRDEFKRSMPGRLVGVSVDAHGRAGLPPGAADARAAHPPREGDLATSARRRCCWR